MAKNIMTSGIEMEDVIKTTGFPVPEDMVGKTFAEVVEGGGSGADLEDNHQTTIDVSTYTEPVEIEPTAGKDGMKKATVTLSNIPSGGSSILKLKGYKNTITEQVVYMNIDNTLVYKGVGEEAVSLDPNWWTYDSSMDAVYLDNGENELVRDTSEDLNDGESIEIEALSVTANGTYTAPSGKAYTPVTVNVPSVSGFAIELENGDSDGFIFSKVIAFGNAQSVGGVIPAGTYNAFFVTDDVREGETHDFTDIPHLFQEPSNVSASVSGYAPNYYTVTISENTTLVNSGEYDTLGRSALLVLYPSNM